MRYAKKAAADGLTICVYAMTAGGYIRCKRKVGYPQILDAHIPESIVYRLVELTAREH